MLDRFPPFYVYRTGEQVTKENAEYRKGEPYARCGLCTYKRGAKCEIVVGYIAPYQVCDYFRDRDGSMMRPDKDRDGDAKGEDMDNDGE